MIQKALITLDISGEATGHRITAKQGDKNTRTIQAQIVDGGVPANFESGVTAEFVCHKPDHTQVVMDTGFTGSVVTVTLSDQCLTRAGNCRCEFRFKKSDQVLSTVTFLMVVYPSAFDQDAFESSDDYKGLDEATQEAKEAADAANSAAENAAQLAQEAQEAAQKADASAERAQQAAEGIENFWDRADTRYANAITGSGAGASVSCPQIWTGAPLVSAEIQGHTVEQGEGEKGPYNPYQFVGVAPTKITLAGTEQSEEAALPEIAPLHSLPTGIHDTYDPATGIETRRAGMYIITGQESKWSVMTRNRIYTTKPANTPPWSGTVQLDEQTAHGINVSISDNLYIWIDFLVEETDTDTEIAQKAREYFQGQVEAGTPVTVTYPLKEPEITQHDPIAMRPPQSPVTVSADQGELSVTYVKDTNEAIKDPGGVIDRAEAAAEAAEQAAGRANGVIDGAQESGDYAKEMGDYARDQARQLQSVVVIPAGETLPPEERTNGTVYFAVQDDGSTRIEDHTGALFSPATSAGAVEGLAAVATTGKYSSLSGTPGTATQSQRGLMAPEDKTKVDQLKTVATSGLYKDLVGVPGEATSTVAGFMAAADKSKLDSLGIVKTTISSAVSTGGTTFHYTETTLRFGGAVPLQISIKRTTAYSQVNVTGSSGVALSPLISPGAWHKPFAEFFGGSLTAGAPAASHGLQDTYTMPSKEDAGSMYICWPTQIGSGSTAVEWTAVGYGLYDPVSSASATLLKDAPDKGVMD